MTNTNNMHMQYKNNIKHWTIKRHIKPRVTLLFQAIQRDSG